MPPARPNFAFIDAQNLNLGIQSLGWKLDYKKFRLYLKNKYNVEETFLFIGYIASNERLYASFKAAGYTVIFKPAVQMKDGTIKGNVDAELVLHAAAIQYRHYAQAVIVSGDGDFACLAEFLETRHKLLGIITPNRYYSRLLSRYNRYITTAESLRHQVER